MNKIKRAALLLCCCTALSACEEKTPNTLSEPPPSTKTAETSTATEKKEQPSLHFSVDDFVQDAEFTANEPYRLPKLKEEILGDAAKEYNRTIKEIYDMMKEIYEDENNEPYYSDLLDIVNYFIFIDEERGWFSTVSHYIDPKGSPAYEPLTLDLRNDNRPVPFETAMQAYGWTKKDVLEKMKDYYQRMYAWDLTYYYHEESHDDLVPPTLDEFLEQKMTLLNEELEEGLRYSLSEKGLTIYYATSLATFPDGYEESLLLQKTAVEELLNNTTYNACIAIIHHVDDAERKQANIIKEVHPDESGTEKLIIALVDDVTLFIDRVDHDEKQDLYIIREELFHKKMARGEAISLKTILPEEFADIQISGHHPSASDPNSKSIFHHRLLKKGLYADPNTEFIQGFYAKEAN